MVAGIGGPLRGPGTRRTHDGPESRAAGRRRPRRLHLGRARPTAGGARHRHPAHQRHQRGCVEWRRPGERPRPRRPGGREGQPGAPVAAGRPRRPALHPAAAAVAQTEPGHLGRRGAIDVALPDEPAGHGAAALHPERPHRHRGIAPAGRAGAACQRGGRQQWPASRLRSRGDVHRRHPGLGLRAAGVPGRADRRRGLLGRQLRGQSGAVAPVRGPDRCRRVDGRADAPDAHRDPHDRQEHPQSHQRDRLDPGPGLGAEGSRRLQRARAGTSACMC